MKVLGLCLFKMVLSCMKFKVEFFLFLSIMILIGIVLVIVWRLDIWLEFLKVYIVIVVEFKC